MVALLVVALVVTVAAVVLLQRTLQTARAINAKAANISATGRGINTATDAIIQLNMTNDFGKSILGTASPLVGKLDTVVGLAGSIDHSATAINDNATAINSSAHTIGGSGGSIHASAAGIHGQTTAIVPIAASIRQGVAIINQTVDATIAIAKQVKADTGNILTVALKTRELGACIDQKLLGPADGHCS